MSFLPNIEPKTPPLSMLFFVCPLPDTCFPSADTREHNNTGTSFIFHATNKVDWEAENGSYKGKKSILDEGQERKRGKSEIEEGDRAKGEQNYSSLHPNNWVISFGRDMIRLTDSLRS